MDLMQRRQMLLMMQKAEANLFDINAPFQNPNETNYQNTKKRIFTDGTHCTGTSWSNYFMPYQITAYSVSSGVLSVTNNNVYGVGYAIALEPGHTYKLTSDSTNSGKADYVFYASDGTYLSAEKDAIGSNITIPNDATMTVINFYNSLSDSNTSTFTNIQLQKVN